MAITELCYEVRTLPDLSLNKYASLDEKGVDGVLEKHLSFLRQWNRKGILSGISIHLFYFYDGKKQDGSYGVGERGSKLRILFMVRGENRAMQSIPEMVSSSTLSEYFNFIPITYEDFIRSIGGDSGFRVCATMLKKEVGVESSLDNVTEKDYYTVPAWEMNEDGRLYNMFKLMEALDHRMLYRVDLYPVEVALALRRELRQPTHVLRERIYAKGANGNRDFEAEQVLKEYQDMLDALESSPQFITNLFVFADLVDDASVVLDSAGAEALAKGNYDIATFSGSFTMHSFLDDKKGMVLEDRAKGIVMHDAMPGMAVNHRAYARYSIYYLATLFTLEEAAPFFRLPALYEGEVIQRRKETAPLPVAAQNGLFLGRDDNGYDVYVPLKLLQKHAFIAGVPGSGKTNTMHHLTSQMWKEHHIPFLVLEPAKQEYRALANQKGMEDLYIFAPNADMRFPLHINPFEFPKGLMVAEHIRKLCDVFEGAFPLENPMPFLLDTAIEGVYRDNGWEPDTVYTEETKKKFPTMSELYRRLEKELKTTTYSAEVRGNLESALKVRIGSLLRREMGDVFDVPRSTIAPEEWLHIPAVIELESMGSGPANFLNLMLCALIREALKVNPHYDKNYARHVIFIEEAHNLIGPETEQKAGESGDAKISATAFIVKMLAEVRALKEGIVIADQLPTVMAPEVIKNTSLKIGLRITSADDRQLLGSTMAANGLQLEEMATFPIGRSLVSYEGLMRPFAMQTHEWGGDFALPQCKNASRDDTWCRTQCVYYRNGDCIPDRAEREKMVESLNDQQLQKLVMNRPSYRKTVERSLSIECEKFSRRYLANKETTEQMIHFLEEGRQSYDAYDAEWQKLTRDYRDAVAEYPDLEHENPSLFQELGERLTESGRKREQFEKKYMNSPMRKGWQQQVVVLERFAALSYRKLGHWKKLGFTNFSEVIRKREKALHNPEGSAVPEMADNEKYLSMFLTYAELTVGLCYQLLEAAALLEPYNVGQAQAIDKLALAVGAAEQKASHDAKVRLRMLKKESG